MTHVASRDHCETGDMLSGPSPLAFFIGAVSRSGAGDEASTILVAAAIDPVAFLAPRWFCAGCLPSRRQVAALKAAEAIVFSGSFHETRELAMCYRKKRFEGIKGVLHLHSEKMEAVSGAAFAILLVGVLTGMTVQIIGEDMREHEITQGVMAR